MMTSTFPGSRSGSSQSLKTTIQEIQSKREALRSLEAALKRRIGEFKELCLKEGEITGQLPGDYPLQPREPIPQVRRRPVDRSNSNGNLNSDANSRHISPATSVSSSHRIDPVQPQSAYAISSGGRMIFPPRPMSTNSTSSSISTASSNTRSINNQQQQTNMLATPKISSSSSNSRLNGAYPMRNLVIHNNHLPVQYDYSPMQTTRFKRPQELPNNSNSNFDNELSSGLMRASSTASTSSSSGSAASSTLSTATIPNTRLNNNINMLNLHARSCSESMDHHPAIAFQPSKAFSCSQEVTQQQYHLKNSNKQPPQTMNLQPVRPPRGVANGGQHEQQQQHQQQQPMRKFDSVDCDLKSKAENRYQSVDQPATKPSESFSVRALQHINIDGKGSFVPYYEETKPFQMSDFYKYSSKHRQKVVTSDATDPSATKTKTTRQLQEDVKKNSLKFSSCDDQKIQNSMRIIERSGQKLIEATAKAIAVNPGLAERINSILPNPTSDKY